MTKIFRCETCKSTDVSQDAVARWCVETQQWEISCLLDNQDCSTCGDETTLECVEVEPGYHFAECHICEWRGLESDAKNIDEQKLICPSCGEASVVVQQYRRAG